MWLSTARSELIANSPTRPIIRTELTSGRSFKTKMPFQPTIAQIRLDNIIVSLNAAVTIVEVVSKRLETPYLGPIVTTIWSLLSVVQVTHWSVRIHRN
jgi:hypothetical protein